jgi:hypothetical protein
MGEAAQSYVRECHDLDRNYLEMEAVLKSIAAKGVQHSDSGFGVQDDARHGNTDPSHV